MLDLRFIRTNTEQVREALAKKKGATESLDELLVVDENWRRVLQEVEELRGQRNTVSHQIAELKKQKKDASAEIEAMRQVAARIKELEGRLKEHEEQLDHLLMRIPNMPHDSVPVGDDESDNRLVRSWGEPRQFGFEPKAHWDIGPQLGILDFERAAKMAGARFALNLGLGARLERALINFMLDLHTREHGFKEAFPPFLASTDSMAGTGQLPKFAEDMFRVEGTDLWLIPTAEVPITNIHREEILKEEDLPLYYTAYSACFRREAGAHGRDTRGLIRLHQFNKVELVKYVKPEDSYDELETLTRDAERVLQLLELPYQVVTLSTGDMSFASAKTYDLEVWLPGYNTYREISSCSNFEDFQARRAGIRFRRSGGNVEFVHTLNGSGLAIGRTVAAILENYQQEDGSVLVPEVLRPYMAADRIAVDLEELN